MENYLVDINIISDEILQGAFKAAIEILENEVKPFCIYLLGSASRNELREDSDIDIAYLTDEQIDSYSNFIISQNLCYIFNREVDLINLKESSTVFKAQVVGTGKVLYCTNDLKRQYFEMRALKEYALLNEEREIILKGIRERGNVYG